MAGLLSPFTRALRGTLTGLSILLFLITASSINSYPAESLERPAKPVRQEAKGSENTERAGPPVRGEKQERLCREALEKICAGQDAGPYFSDWTVFMPGLWNRFGMEIEKSGVKTKPAIFLVPDSETGKVTSLLGKAIPREDMATCLRCKELSQFIKGMKSGKIRSASQDERNTFYTLIPFEIKNEPITVVESGNIVLLMYCNDNRIFMLDLLSEHKWGNRE